MNTLNKMDTACRANALGKGKCGLVAVSTIPGAGLGLFSVKHYEKSDIVCIYGGEYIQSGNGGQYVLELTNSLSVDARDEQSFHHRDLGRYVNHSDDPDLINTKYKIRMMGGKYPVALIVATKSISPGTELLVNYGPTYPFDNGVTRPYTKPMVKTQRKQPVPATRKRNTVFY